MKSEAKVIATYRKIKGNNSRSGQGGSTSSFLIRLTGFWVLDQFLDSPTSCQPLLHPQQPHNRKRRRLRSVETRLRCMSIRNLNTKELIRTARQRHFYLRRDNSRDVQQQSVGAMFNSSVWTRCGKSQCAMLAPGEIIQCAFDTHSAWTTQLSSHITQVSLWGGVRLYVVV